MKFRCINNQDVETLITVGKVYAGNMVKPSINHIWDTHIVIYRCDDKSQCNFLANRFEPAEELVAPELKTFVYTYSLETK